MRRFSKSWKSIYTVYYRQFVQTKTLESWLSQQPYWFILCPPVKKSIEKCLLHHAHVSLWVTDFRANFVWKSVTHKLTCAWCRRHFSKDFLTGGHKMNQYGYWDNQLSSGFCLYELTVKYGVNRFSWFWKSVHIWPLIDWE